MHGCAKLKLSEAAPFQASSQHSGTPVQNRLFRVSRSGVRILRNLTFGDLTKQICTHTQYVIFISLPLQQWLHEFDSVFRYTKVACLDK